MPKGVYKHHPQQGFQKGHKISEKLWKNPEYRKHVSASHKGYKFSEEAKQKISKSNRESHSSILPLTIIRREHPKAYEAERQRLRRQIFPELMKSRERVYSQTHFAVRVGILIKPKKCEGCGKKRKLDGHHPNYSISLKVIWLCKLCHSKLHNQAIDQFHEAIDKL